MRLNEWGDDMEAENCGPEDLFEDIKSHAASSHEPFFGFPLGAWMARAYQLQTRVRALEDEIERMKPVYEAAIKHEQVWRNTAHHHNSCVLCSAVREARGEQ